VAQITIYVRDDIARRIKREARRARKSLSAYLIELAIGEKRGAPWPSTFFELQGSCRGTIREPDDPPPEEPDAL
jgi:hypothetical protein